MILENAEALRKTSPIASVMGKTDFSRAGLKSPSHGRGVGRRLNLVDR
jgi:hypothetical protein